MTRAQFLAALERLDLKQGRFAELTGLHPATVYHWRDGQIPLWAERLLAAWVSNRDLERDRAMARYREEQMRARLAPLEMFAE